MQDIRLVRAGGLIGRPCGWGHNRWAWSIPGMRSMCGSEGMYWSDGGRDLGFGRSLWFSRFKASHLEIRHQLVGNFGEDRLSQSLHGGLQGATWRENDHMNCDSMTVSLKMKARNFNKAEERIAGFSTECCEAKPPSNLVPCDPLGGGWRNNTFFWYWSRIGVIFFSFLL